MNRDMTEGNRFKEYPDLDNPGKKIFRSVSDDGSIVAIKEICDKDGHYLMRYCKRCNADITTEKRCNGMCFDCLDKEYPGIKKEFTKNV